MKSVKWRAVLRSACSLASVSVLLFGALAAAATEVVIAPPDKGTLYLETSQHKMQFRWDPVAPDEDIIVQNLLDKSWTTWKWWDICVLKLLPATVPPTETTPGVGLATVSASGGVPGVFGDHIGVKGTGGCGDINPGESLTIALGGALTGYQVYYTEINIEMRNQGVVQVDTTFNGQTRTFVIRSPSGVAPGPAGAEVINCVFETGTSEVDICRWKTDAVWDSAKFKTLAGKVSIEGGSGGGDGEFSKFSLTKFDTVLACAPIEGPPVVGITVEGPDDSEASLTRLQNSDPDEDCQPIPISLEWTEGENPVLQFFKADLSQSVVTTFEIIWPNEPAPDVEGNVLGSIPLSEQEFVAGEPLPIDLCVGTPGYVLVEGESILESLTPPEGGFPDLVPESEDTTQYGCVYERHVTLPEEDTVGLRELIYLQGDWGASRAF